MRRRVSLYRIGGLVLIGSLFLILILILILRQFSLPPMISRTTEPQAPGLADWWNEQAAAAEQSNQSEVASVYKARIDGYSLSLQPSNAASTDALPPAAARFTTAKLYERVPLASQPSSDSDRLAKFEPASGVYLGMLGADRRVSYDVTKVESVYGRRHAMYLAYVGWRKFQADTNSYFPVRTAERVKAMGGALQIGWEPRYGLEDVKDDEYVRTFAREAKASGIPVFLRYASEMNGGWVAWHGNPQLYVEKFRLIHDIMKEEAPNVAMVWSPNFAPADNMDEYYPGDDYVDWVGFSLYATPLSNGAEQLNVSLIDTFAPLYAKYSRKPIMISEGAVAHTVLSTNTAYWQWAEGQLSYMYGVLPRIFPMVKAVTYFNFSRAQAMRSQMDYVYDLGENPYTDALYRRMIQSDWYIGKVETDKPSQGPRYAYEPADPGKLSGGPHELLFHGQLSDGTVPFAVELSEGTRRLGISYQMPWEFTVQWPSRPEVNPSGSNKPLKVIAYNERMEPVAEHILPDN